MCVNSVTKKDLVLWERFCTVISASILLGKFKLFSFDRVVVE